MSNMTFEGYVEFQDGEDGEQDGNVLDDWYLRMLWVIDATGECLWAAYPKVGEIWLAAV